MPILEDRGTHVEKKSSTSVNLKKINDAKMFWMVSVMNSPINKVHSSINIANSPFAQQFFYQKTLSNKFEPMLSSLLDKHLCHKKIIFNLILNVLSVSIFI